MRALLPLLCVVLLGFLFPFPKAKEELLWGALSDALHFPVFIFIAFYLRSVLSKYIHPSRRCLSVTLGATILLVFLIEGIQPAFGRSASFEDILNGTLGSLVGGLSFELFMKRQTLLGKLLTIGIAASIQLYILLPSFHGYQALEARARALPRLSNYGSVSEKLFWKALGSESSLLFADGLVVSAKDSSWAGIEYKAQGLNISSYLNLNIEIENPTPESLQLNIRIDDYGNSEAFEDRFNAAFDVAPGRHTFRFSIEKIQQGPKSRVLDVTSIQRILLFTRSSGQQKHWIIKQIYFS